MGELCSDHAWFCVRVADLERKLEKHRDVVVLESDETGASGKVVMRSVLPDKPGARFIVRLGGDAFSGRVAKRHGGKTGNYWVHIYMRLGGTRIWPRRNNYFFAALGDYGSPFSGIHVAAVEADKSDEQRTISVVVSDSTTRLYEGAVLEITEI